MQFIKTLLWVLVGGTVGRMVVAIFLMQILIVKNCAKKMFRRIRNDHEYWDSAACEKYLNGVIWKNVVILTVISILVILFAPNPAKITFFLSAFFWWLITRSKSGLTDDNMKETCDIFLRFAKPEKKEEMKELLPDLISSMSFERFFGKPF